MARPGSIRVSIISAKIRVLASADTLFFSLAQQRSAIFSLMSITACIENSGVGSGYDNKGKNRSRMAMTFSFWRVMIQRLVCIIADLYQSKPMRSLSGLTTVDLRGRFQNKHDLVI